MTDGPVPVDVREFIVRHIDSIAQLEALLLLRREASGDWNIAQVAQRLYTSESEVAEVLARLCADGLLSCRDEVYRYDPGTPEIREMVDRLATVYARQLIPVTNIIHGKPRRIREFADAFKFRKDR